MTSLKRRLMQGVMFGVCLIAVALMLRLALEWRQALADINAMIVTPVTLPAAAEALDSSSGLPMTNDTALSSEQGSNSGAQYSAQVTSTPLSTAHNRRSSRPLTILLLGTDARPDIEATRTDAVIVIHIDYEHDRVSMLSIPRDLWVTYPGYGDGRINAAYAVGEQTFGPGGGAALAKRTVGHLLGLKIDYFALVNFDGFSSLIDYMGGITVDVPSTIDDPEFPTEDYGTIKVHFRAGLQHMNGERALVYARTRHADSDFGRNQRQQLILMSIFQTVQKRGLLQQITSLDDYTGALRDHVRTDMPRRTMLELAQWGRDLEFDDIRRYAIDSTMIYTLREPATFAIESTELQRLVGQVTGTIRPSAGGLYSEDE